MTKHNKVPIFVIFVRFLIKTICLHHLATQNLVLNIFAYTGKNSGMYLSTAEIDTATYIALSNDNVLSARTFEHDGYVVIALLTGPIFSQTERMALKKSVQTDVSDRLDVSLEQVIVTFDMELYRAMDEVDGLDKQKLLAMALERCD